MTSKESLRYRSTIYDDAGTLRGRIPTPLINHLHGRAGDNVVFEVDADGRLIVSLSRKVAQKKTVRGRASKRG